MILSASSQSRLAMSKALTSPKRRNGASVTMDVDETPSKTKKKSVVPNSSPSLSSVENSASDSDSVGDGGYETGDSVEFEQAISSQDDFEGKSDSESNSGSETGDDMDVDPVAGETEPEPVLSHAQKLLRAAIDEELEQIQILPSKSNSTTYEDAHNESNHVKLLLKNLKTLIESCDARDVVWKSKESKSSKKSSSRAVPSTSSSDFNATTFLSHFYEEFGGSALVSTLKNEFSVNFTVPGSSASAPPSDSGNTLFKWQPPTSINVIGSYLLGTGLRQKRASSHQYTIDLAVTMPDEIFKHRDIKGHRYDTKRLLYLAVLGEFLKSQLSGDSGLSNVEWMVPRVEDISAPLLTLEAQVNLGHHESSKSSSSKKRNRSVDSIRRIQIVIHPVITPSTFKLSQLLPWKPQLVNFGNFPNDHVAVVYNELTASIKSLLPDAPLVVQKSCLTLVALHNHRIARDSTLIHENRELAGIFQNYPALRQAVVLAMRWLQPRHLTSIFNTYTISMLFVHLLESGVLKPKMDALDLFRAWISWLSKERIAKLVEIERIQNETHGAGTSATRNIHLPPPIIALQKSKSLPSDADWKTAHTAYSEEILKRHFAECYEVVLISKTGYLNVLANVSAAAWSNLTFEAVLASQVLEHPDQYAFGSLFKTMLSQGDQAINLRQNPPISSEFDLWLTAAPNATEIAKIPLIKLEDKLVVYKKAEPTTVAHKMQSTAMLGGKKAGVQTITILSPSEVESTQKVDDAKTKEASEWMAQLSQSIVALNALDTVSLQKLISVALLFQSLAPRVEYIYSMERLTNQDGKTSFQFDWDEILPSQLSFHIGARVQPTQWLKLLEYGPQAQQETDVADFIKIWGKDKAGLRKFKDGMILYCVSWGTPPTTFSPSNIHNLAAAVNKHRIVKTVVSHLLNRHLSLSGGDASNWSVHQLGDEVLYDLLKAPERVDDDLVGPTFKSTPAPLSNTESHDHINFVWTQLQKVLRGLKGLSMPIKSLVMPGTFARSTSAVPPQYNPLSDPEINFSMRQHAIRASATASQLCPATIPIVLQFESSGAWPEDLDAISHVKTALYLELARHLTEQQASTVATRSTSDELFIFFKGYTFRVVVFYPHELVIRNMLYRQAVMVQRTEQQQKLLRDKLAQMEKMQQIEKEGTIVPSKHKKSTTMTPEMLARQRGPLVGPIDTHVEPLQSVLDDFSRYNVSPKITGLLRSLHLAYPAYGPTCVLVKKWMGAHLLPLAEFADGLLVDLLVARAFHSHPYLCAPWSVPPSHAYAAFLRVLYLLANLAWAAGPFLVPLHETHEGVAVALTATSKQHTAPLGWTLEKVQKIMQRWKATDEAERALWTICYADGSSGIEEESSSSEEVHATSRIPGVATIAYGTPNGPTTHDGWRVDSFVAKSVLTRAQKLAASALSQFDSHMANTANDAPDHAFKVMFEPSLLDFDLVIEIKKSALTQHPSLNWDAKKRSKSSTRFIGQTQFLEPPSEYVNQVETIQSSSAASKAPPLLPDFNPTANFIQQLSERLAARSLVFHDASGGALIAIVLKPSAFVPTGTLTSTNAIHALPLTDSQGKRAGIISNIVQIIGEIWHMGEGIVQQIHLVAGQHKLKV